ncbi:unnamed protein product [Closterium sp. NIES-64]|nr:unnamed protein product [Closterium sp. NIES-64]
MARSAPRELFLASARRPRATRCFCPSPTRYPQLHPAALAISAAAPCRPSRRTASHRQIPATRTLSAARRQVPARPPVDFATAVKGVARVVGVAGEAAATPLHAPDREEVWPEGDGWGRGSGGVGGSCKGEVEGVGDPSAATAATPPPLSLRRCWIRGGVGGESSYAASAASSSHPLPRTSRIACTSPCLPRAHARAVCPVFPVLALCPCPCCPLVFHVPVLPAPGCAPPVSPMLSILGCAPPVSPVRPVLPMLPPCSSAAPVLLPCPAPFCLCCPVVPVLPRSARVAPFSPCPAPFSPCPAQLCPCCPVQPVSCPVQPVSCPALPVLPRSARVLPRSARAAPFCPFVPYPCCPYPLVPHPCYQCSLVPHPVCAARSRAARHPRAVRPVQHLVATRTRYPYPCSSHTMHQLRGVQPQPGTCSTAVVQMLLGGCCLSASEGAPCWVATPCNGVL